MDSNKEGTELLQTEEEMDKKEKYTISDIDTNTRIEENPEKSQEEHNEDSTKIKKPISIRLLDQGSQGCIFRPEITCEGEVGDVQYISKVQKKNESTMNEIAMGKNIAEKIAHYDSYFVPIINACPSNISMIETDEIKKCRLFDDTEPNFITSVSESKYISTKIRYVSKKSIEFYLKALPREEEWITKKIYSTWQHLLNGLKKLTEAGIIHNDLKENNILYDDHNQSPMIIDFGLSYIAPNVSREIEPEIFYTDKFYPYWCLEIQILSYIVQRIRPMESIPENAENVQTGGDPILIEEIPMENPISTGSIESIQEIPIDTIITKEQLKYLYEHCVSEMMQYLEEHGIPFTAEEKNEYAERYDNYFAKYIGQSWEKLKAEWYKPEIYNTWDLYSLSVVYLIITKSTDLSSYPDASHFIERYIKLWKSIVLALPGERKSLEEVQNEINQIPL